MRVMALFSTSFFAKYLRVGEDGPGRGHLCHTDTFLVITFFLPKAYDCCSIITHSYTSQTPGHNIICVDDDISRDIMEEWHIDFINKFLLLLLEYGMQKV